MGFGQSFLQAFTSPALSAVFGAASAYGVTGYLNDKSWAMPMETFYANPKAIIITACVTALLASIGHMRRHSDYRFSRALDITSSLGLMGYGVYYGFSHAPF